jgi:Leucine-rich repeat (LRR) protein
MKWNYKDYIKWLDDGHIINENVLELDITNHNIKNIDYINNLPMLQILNCGSNQITQLDNLNLPMLQDLYCSYNRITQLDNLNLPMLQVLNCHKNRITQLDNLNLPMLQELYCCCNNKITQLDNLNHPMLQILDCGSNQIIQLDNLNLPMLQILDCSYNRITQLDNLNHPLLQKIYCSNNKLTQLDNLNLPMLQTLHCNDNQITQLRLQYVQNLQYIDYSNNMIEFIAPNLLRAINNTRQNIYTDHQNVHNHNIQECIRKSISNIINIPPTIQSLSDYIVKNKILTEQSKQLLFEYIEDKTIHSTLLITFEELLLHTMSVIDKNKHMDEILKIMNIELDDSLCKCYTGRMSRIINCLNGFSDLVQVQISDSEQIGQIISIVKDLLISKEEYTVEKHKNLARAELVNRGYSNDIIETWIAFIE